MDSSQRNQRVRLLPSVVVVAAGSVCRVTQCDPNERRHRAPCATRPAGRKFRLVAAAGLRGVVLRRGRPRFSVTERVMAVRAEGETHIA